MSRIGLKAYILESDGSHTPFGSPREYSSKLFDPAESMSESGRTKTPQVHNIRWVPKGESVKVAGREIGGMVYITDIEPSDLNPEENLSVCINTTMPVARRRKSYKVSYDPYYEQFYEHYCYLTNNVRAIYLDWLESGRENDKYTYECLILYFGGLERRYLNDDPSLSERKEILNEIEGLIEIYGEDEGFANTLRSFLNFTQTLRDPNQVKTLIERDNTKFPLSLAIGLGRSAMNRESINADWALSWYLCSVKTQKSNIVYRCWPEYIVLFRDVFNEMYPKGLYVTAKGSDIEMEYVSYSPYDFRRTFIFKSTNGRIVPEVISLSEPIKQLDKIGLETSKLLAHYSEYIKGKPEARDTVNALRLLPKDLWKKMPCRELEKIREWAYSVLKRNGGLAEINDFLVNTIGNTETKPNTTVVKNAADFLAMAGFGVVQDPRFALEKRRFWSSVNLFSMPSTKNLEKESSDLYKNANLALVAGLYILEEFGLHNALARRSRKNILEYLMEHIEGLNPIAYKRLEANFEFYLDHSPSIKMINKPLAEALDDSKELISKLVTTLVVNEDIQETQEFSRIEHVYDKLGLNQKQLWKDVIDIRNTIPDENTELNKRSTKSRVKSSDKRRGKIVTLDEEKIYELISETESVKNVLENVFQSSDMRRGHKIKTEKSFELSEVFVALDPSCIPVTLEIITKGHWTRNAVEKLARKHKVMWEGSLEAINEWSYEKYDEELIEEYEGYRPNTVAVEKLKESIRAQARE